MSAWRVGLNPNWVFHFVLYSLKTRLGEFLQKRTWSDNNKSRRSCRPWINDGRVIGFEIVGEAFVWNQVRRIANAMLAVVTGYKTVERVIEARDNPEVEIDLGLADPDWLILWSVSWDGISGIDTEEPNIPKPDHSSKRWQEICRQQQKDILIRQLTLFKGNTDPVTIIHRTGFT